jgi:glycerol-3-phosphate dehydrogenase
MYGKSRSELLEQAQQQEFDVLVIGGGIVGAGVALDAISRGLSVLLLEKDDFASGTSSRTSKLVHGGLRYLEQRQFKLVMELSAERAVLEKLAPHMVQDISFALPFPSRAPLFALKALAGLTVYDLMSWSLQHRSHRRLSHRQMMDLCPSLSAQAIGGGARFYDCMTDDSRLVLEVAKTACKLGAVALNYVAVQDFHVRDGAVTGAICLDRYQGKSLSVRCKTCINATGVWIDSSYRKLKSDWVNCVIPSKGTHIVVPQSALGTNTGLFLPTDDQRYVFVIPWQHAVIIGTTDRVYSGDLDHVRPTIEEVDYLLYQVNRYIGRGHLTCEDVIACWSGLRPLAGDTHMTADTNSVSREQLVFEGPNGTVGIVGGKLTNFRIIAAQAVDMLRHHFTDRNLKDSRTDKIMLGGWANTNDYLAASAHISARARRLSIEPATVDHLLSTYGTDADKILDLIEADHDLNEKICLDFPPLLAEIPFSVRNEMVVSLEDMLMRRLRLGMLDQHQCLEAAPVVAEIMADELGWDRIREKLELSTFEKLLDEHLAILTASVN